MTLASTPVLAPVAARPAAWLRTRRLRLREFVVQDRPQLVQMHADARMRALLIDDHPLHRHDVCEHFLRRLQPLYRAHEGLGIWHAERSVRRFSDAELAAPAMREALTPAALAALAQPVDEFVGWFNLMPMPGRDGEIELGARLLPRAWGVGLSDEGGEALLQHAFETLGRERVWAVCHVRHEAVRSCVLALGFMDAGVLPYEGEPARHYLITRADWLASQALPRRARLRRAIAGMRNAAAVA
ncbi:GNAT family N-acetyltransferase [Scleromatobacter humisilvae]|uniref:GNAT family N-acetyltransferase n=1 Tax=Scleromatobacter humisilvae TaxID=2897159 RepID=A0A9X2C244_9BURK|nr:GNAT family N-acetyltransferase [Scleromatobacter humisilvae]MCK9689523.1 GNAT family N-acetyltransferase [Scleromatobacter humisilvae]